MIHDWPMAETTHWLPHWVSSSSALLLCIVSAFEIDSPRAAHPAANPCLPRLDPLTWAIHLLSRTAVADSERPYLLSDWYLQLHRYQIESSQTISATAYRHSQLHRLIDLMVYCGKPSKGCGACRARKVKVRIELPTSHGARQKTAKGFLRSERFRMHAEDI